MGRRLTERGFRLREEKQKKDLAPLVEEWAHSKFCYHIEIFSYGRWSFTMGSQETSNGFNVREHEAHNVMNLIRKKLKVRSKYFHWLGSHDWGAERKMHLHIVLRINSRKRFYWQTLERVIRAVNQETKQNIQTFLVDPAKVSDLSKNQVLYPLKVKDSMVEQFIPRKPFTSRNFDAKKAKAPPVEKIRESSSVSERQLKDLRYWMEETGGGVTKHERYKIIKGKGTPQSQSPNYNQQRIIFNDTGFHPE